MENCSYFIPDKALFGSFPDQKSVQELEALGVRYFIDLTYDEEDKTIPYNTQYVYIKYPIKDRNIPEDWKSFAQLIIKIYHILNNLKNQEKIYINCRGGHGRSGILVACILCFYYDIQVEEALRQTSKYHSNRPVMKEKWRKLGSPQGKRQKDFVYRFFKPLKFNKSENNSFTDGLSNLSNHTVIIPDVGVFPNAYLAFQAYRDINNKDYINNLLKGFFIPDNIKEHNRDWEENKIDYMYKVLKYKVSQHQDLRTNLINTGLRPLLKISQDSFWGDGYNGQGKNIHGKLLNKLRSEFLYEEFLHEEFNNP
jgi:protein-tyrosine phosphatase